MQNYMPVLLVVEFFTFIHFLKDKKSSKNFFTDSLNTWKATAMVCIWMYPQTSCIHRWRYPDVAESKESNTGLRVHDKWISPLGA